MAQCDTQLHDPAAAEKSYTRGIELLKKFGTAAEVKEAEASLAKTRRRAP
jgi:hypothetical protein